MAGERRLASCVVIDGKRRGTRGVFGKAGGEGGARSSTTDDNKVIRGEERGRGNEFACCWDSEVEKEKDCGERSQG